MSGRLVANMLLPWIDIVFKESTLYLNRQREVPSREAGKPSTKTQKHLVEA